MAGVGRPSIQDSSTSEMDSRRNCPICNIRMSSMNYDLHTRCSTCRGKDCQENDKCTECEQWTQEVFNKYIRHKRSLEKKSKSKERKKERDNKKDISDVSDSHSEGLGVDPLTLGDPVAPSGGGITETVSYTHLTLPTKA